MEQICQSERKFSFTRTGGIMLLCMQNAVNLAILVYQDLLTVLCEIFTVLFWLAYEFLDFSHFTTVTQLNSVD